MKIIEILKLLGKLCLWTVNWVFNTSAFILLPLIIYVIIYLILKEPMSELLKLPEWMFIAIVLYGDALSKNINLYNKLDKNEEKESYSGYWDTIFEGFYIESQFAVSLAILGITISSVLLTLAIIAKYKELDISSIFYFIENIVFLFAIVYSAICELFIRNYNDKEKKKKLLNQNK